MTRPATFALGLGIGAWIFPLGLHLAARISNRHYLSIKE